VIFVKICNFFIDTSKIVHDVPFTKKRIKAKDHERSTKKKKKKKNTTKERKRKSGLQADGPASSFG
jgi:hypothetical protein